MERRGGEGEGETGGSGVVGEKVGNVVEWG